MSAINDLINQIQDAELRERIQKEVNKLAKQKKFGLVFEEHLPECTPLYDIPVKKGNKVALKSGNLNDTFAVIRIDGDKAYCVKRDSEDVIEYSVTDLVTVAEFGDSIYPYLKPIDSICNAPDSDLWHTLIEADNYHALQLLEYLYPEKVDCIYIDPPYNKEESKDWKYNCNYVDGSDQYRHSKWLSMIEKRLKIAKRILNPDDSVLIVTIDEEEYLHLGCLLEEMFPESKIQMITDVINPRGTNRGDEFSRVEEYIFVCRFGNASVCKSNTNMLGNTDEVAKSRVWFGFNRGNNPRSSANAQFFPIYIDEKQKKIIRVGESMEYGTPIDKFPKIDGLTAVFPINSRGGESIWRAIPSTTREWIDKGYVKVSQFDEKNNRWTLSYIPSGLQSRIESGEIVVENRCDDGSLDIKQVDSSDKKVNPRSVWLQKYHNATDYGASIIKNIIPNHTFSYPKSLYAVHDTLQFFVGEKPNALVVDFFAGSGTTLHAINLLNAEDNGNRRCILITNNEIGVKEEGKMKLKNIHPGDDEWEKNGIARYVTWPRTVCSIKGIDINGKKLKDTYLTTLSQIKEEKRKFTQISFLDSVKTWKISEKKKLVSILSKGIIPSSMVLDTDNYIISDDEKHNVSVLIDDNHADEWIEDLSEMEHITEFIVITKNNKLMNSIKDRINNSLGPIKKDISIGIPMSDGFKTNANYFKLGFLDKTKVSLGMQFAEMLPTLWMKAGAHGPCPTANNDNLPDMLVLPENKMAVLINENSFAAFSRELENKPEIGTVFIITDYDINYRNMIKGLNVKNTYQLYRDYLDNFRINHGRN